MWEVAVNYQGVYGFSGRPLNAPLNNLKPFKLERHISVDYIIWIDLIYG